MQNHTNINFDEIANSKLHALAMKKFPLQTDEIQLKFSH